MFTGVITFSAFEEDNGTVAQIQALIRANDPIYEMSFRLGIGHKSEDAFWEATLKYLAQHLGVANPQPTLASSLVDPCMQWKEWRNIWHNAGIRSGFYMPVTIIKKLSRRA